MAFMDIQDHTCVLQIQQEMQINQLRSLCLPVTSSNVAVKRAIHLMKQINTVNHQIVCLGKTTCKQKQTHIIQNR